MDIKKKSHAVNITLILVILMGCSPGTPLLHELKVNRKEKREPIHRSVNVLSFSWLIFSLSVNHRLIRPVYISDFFVARQPPAHPSGPLFGLHYSPGIAA